MSDGEALLRAILTQPEEDTPRLVYADWLEENGHPTRAEFIRVQIGLSKRKGRDEKHCPECGRERRYGWRQDDEEWTDCPENHHWKPRDHILLQRRERELFCWDNIEKWFGHSPWLRTTVYPSEFDVLTRENIFGMMASRGFVSHLTCSLAELFDDRECELCLGRGDIWAGSSMWSPSMPTKNGYAKCPACERTGRRPGLAATLWKTHPVTRVVLSDREPADRTSVNGCWYWFKRTETGIDHLEPPETYLLVDLFEVIAQGDQSIVGMPFPTRDLALAALSTACVTLGRQLAKGEAAARNS